MSQSDEQTPVKVLEWMRKSYDIYGWCKDDLAQNEHGKGVSPISSYADKFCLLGMMMHCCPNQGKGRDRYLRTRVEAHLCRAIEDTQCYHSGIVPWNDIMCRGIEDVRKVVDRALTIAMRLES